MKALVIGSPAVLFAVWVAFTIAALGGVR